MPDFPFTIDLENLDPTLGFTIRGAANLDRVDSVSTAGDINGDGIDDFIIGATNAGAAEGGSAYVIYGRDADADPFADIDLATLDPSDGFEITGGSTEELGKSVSSAGDVNGDGIDDLIVGDPGTFGGTSNGTTYVIFGRDGGGFTDIDLAALTPADGFSITGSAANDQAGFSVSGTSDINGDGIDDLIVGAFVNDDNGYDAGKAYVIYGKDGGGFTNIDLATPLAPADGFEIVGKDMNDGSAVSVSDAGDVNGDGIADLIVGAFVADSPDLNYTGNAYVIYGRDENFAGPVNLGALTPSDGFTIFGDALYDQAGRSVSGAGDVNGDGIDDILIGVSRADPDGELSAGNAYVIFGVAGGSGDIDLGDPLDPSVGFQIKGDGAYDSTGFTASDAGDVNGDGFDDVIVGGVGDDTAGTNAGAAYVIFGKASGFGTIDLAALDPADGFQLLGGVDDAAGYSVSAAGDVNGDGFDDMIIGARDGGDNGVYGGEAYVIYGRAPQEAVRRIGSDASQAIKGGNFDDTLAGRGGDDTLDGFDGADTLKGNDGADMLDGRRGVDALNGGRGDDTLRGGGGRDNLNGDEGADRIEAPGSFVRADADVVYGFESGLDDIALDSARFGLPSGALEAGRFTVGNQARDADDRLIYKADLGKLYFDPDGAGGEDQVLIATLVGAPTIDAGDFVVVGGDSADAPVPVAPARAFGEDAEAARLAIGFAGGGGAPAKFGDMTELAVIA